MICILNEFFWYPNLLNINDKMHFLYMNDNFFRILAGDWSCRVHEPTLRDPKRCGSTVGCYS